MVWNGNMEEVYIDNIIPNMGIYLFSEVFRNHRFWLSIKITRLLQLKFHSLVSGESYRKYAECNGSAFHQFFCT